MTALLIISSATTKEAKYHEETFRIYSRVGTAFYIGGSCFNGCRVSETSATTAGLACGHASVRSTSQHPLSWRIQVKKLFASILVLGLLSTSTFAGDVLNTPTQTPHVGDVLVPKKPGTEIVTNTLQVPKLQHGGHVPAKICTDHAQHVLKTLEVDLPAISDTQVHARSTLLMTGVAIDQTGTSVTGWTISDFSVQVRCEMANDVVLFVVAGPNYEDGTANAILASIQKKWNEK
jgi:hypothetical protein